MCDFRKYTGQARNLETDEIVDIPFIEKGVSVNRNLASYHDPPWLVEYEDDPGEVGLYYVEATGAGFAYWDGQEWGSAYSNPQFEFLFEEREHEHSHINQLQGD